MSNPYDVIVVGAGFRWLRPRATALRPERRLRARTGGGRLRRPPAGHDPYEYFNLWGGAMDWQYESVAQPGTAGRRHVLPRGRVLGGTSSLNGMVYLRGSAEDYDGWEAGGCAGWGWHEVRTAFEELEEHLRPGYLPERNPFSQVFIDAAVEAGLPFNPDFDAGTLDGCGWNRSTIVDGAAAQLLPRVPPPRPRPPQPRGPARHRRRAPADRRTGRRDGRRRRGGGRADHGRRGRRHGRRVRLAAAPAALRHRPGGRPRGRRHRRPSSTCRSAATCSTTC